jgi:predicted transposase/invertase (TIGR01784 family)
MTDKFFSPILDFAFKFILGSRQNIDILTAFLTDMLHLPAEELEDITITDPALNRFWRRDKLGILDVLIKTKSGKLISVEIQVRSDTHFRRRVLYYLAKLLWSQIKKGERYEKIQQVISIVICNHDLNPRSEHYLHDYSLRDSQSGEEFTDLLKLITIELPKLPKEPNGKAEWPWLQAFKCKTMEETMSLAQRFPQLGRVVEALRELTLTDDERWYVDMQEKARWAQYAREQDRFNEGKTTGRAEGLAEGETKGLAEGEKKYQEQIRQLEEENRRLRGE